MTRAMGTLEHPIPWGLIASMCVANVFYIYRERLFAALGRTGFFVFMTFTSLSTGPLLSVACQLGLIAWDRALAFLRFRWLLLVYLVLFGVLLLRIGAEFQIRDVHRQRSLLRQGLRRRPPHRLRLRPDGGEAASGLRHRPE